MINNPVLFNPPINHVAVADVDAAYGAYAAAKNNAFNNTNNSNSTANELNLMLKKMLLTLKCKKSQKSKMH